jgi:hypothetical protein
LTYDANRMVQAIGGRPDNQTSLLKNYYGVDGLRARKFSGTLGETLFVSQFFDILSSSQTRWASAINE